jgi:phosphate transport system substrate-binding protein
LLLVAVGCCSELANAGERINIGGATTLVPVVKQAATQFQTSHSGVEIVVGGGGSSFGIEAVGTGKVQIGMASRDLKDEEKSKYGDLIVTAVGKDGIVFIVNAKNSVKGLTKDQVQGLFIGTIKNWKEVGGEDQPVEILTINAKHSTFELICHHFNLDAKESGTTMTFAKKGTTEWSANPAQTTNSHPQTLAILATKPNGIGYTSIGLALKFTETSKRVKLLALDGQEATVAKVADGSYQLQRPLYVLTKGQPAGAAKEFIDYLSSKDGQTLIQQFDFVTVAAP